MGRRIVLIERNMIDEHSFDSISVYYEDGSKEVISDEAQINECFEAYARSLGMNLEDVLNNPDLVRNVPVGRNGYKRIVLIERNMTGEDSFDSISVYHNDGEKQIIRDESAIERSEDIYAISLGMARDDLKRNPDLIRNIHLFRDLDIPSRTPDDDIDDELDPPHISPRRGVPVWTSPARTPEGSEPDLDPVEEDLDDEESLDDDLDAEHSSSRRRRKKGKKVVAWVTSLALVAAGGYYGLKKLLGDGFTLNLGQPKAYNQSLDNPTNYGLGDDNYYSVERRNDRTYNGSNFIDNLEASHQQGNLGSGVREIRYNPDMLKSEKLDIINRLNLDLAANIADVDGLLSGHGIHNDKYILRLESLFPQGTIEYDAIKHFCGLRNSIVNQAYETQNIDMVRDQVEKFNKVYSLFVFNGYNLSSEKAFQYYQLEDLAKYIIVGLGKQVLSLPDEYSFDYINGKKWDKKTLQNESVILFNDVTSNMLGRSK